jgi:hypothetical protein
VDLDPRTAPFQEIITHAGQDLRLVGHVQTEDDDGDLSDTNISGWSILVMLRNQAGGTVLTLAATVTSGSTGRWAATIPYADDLGLASTIYDWEARRTDSGYQEVLASGTAQWLPSVITALTGGQLTGTPRSGAAPLAVTFSWSGSGAGLHYFWQKSSDSGSTYVEFDDQGVASPTETFDAGTWFVHLEVRLGGPSGTLIYSQTLGDYVTAT